MVGTRTLRSLAQYLELQDGEWIAFLLEKHGLYADGVLNSAHYKTRLLTALAESLDSATEPQISALLEDIARTPGDLRNRVNPRYRYHERFDDLQRCLQLDGYCDLQTRGRGPATLGCPGP